MAHQTVVIRHELFHSQFLGTNCRRPAKCVMNSFESGAFDPISQKSRDDTEQMFPPLCEDITQKFVKRGPVRNRFLPDHVAVDQYDGGIDLWLRPEDGGGQFAQDLQPALRLEPDRQRTVVAGLRDSRHSLGEFELDGDDHPRPGEIGRDEIRDDGRCRVVGQVGDEFQIWLLGDAENGPQGLQDFIRQMVFVPQHILIEQRDVRLIRHFQGRQFGHFRIVFDRDELPRAAGDFPGQAAGACADFENDIVCREFCGLNNQIK